jgi:hypothetical protein
MVVKNDLFKPIPLGNYIVITEYLCRLAAKAPLSPLFCADIADVTWRLERSGLPLTNAEAESLREFGRRITAEGAAKVNPEELAGLARSVLVSLRKEAEKKEVILLPRTAVSGRLKNLSQAMRLTRIQRRLVAETVRCMEYGSYRAAIIMGWNLAYDYVCHWASKTVKRRAAFNKTLKARFTTETGTPVYPAGIKQYEDFFSIEPPLSEWAVLETMRDARLLPVPIHDQLCRHLRERDNFAHPNFKMPSNDQASACIDDLLGLIMGQPFKR